ncbi:hypothetical protein Ddc_19165 [Ditylenchus destructor]|nr:hypothetical protein Ddc_19165 [Ditylenchus destructor]
MSIVVVAFMAFSMCSAKSVGFKNLAKQVFALSDETVACWVCHKNVAYWDTVKQLPEKINTPEKLAKAWEKNCRHVSHGVPMAEFCKAIAGKYDIFAKAYFQHRDNPEIDPCKVAGVCPAKFVQFNNLASLSQAFTLSDETHVCNHCKRLVAFFDRHGDPGPLWTPEIFANYMEECKALKGKFLVFSLLLFRRRDHPEVEPCKEAQVC